MLIRLKHGLSPKMLCTKQEDGLDFFLNAKALICDQMSLGCLILIQTSKKSKRMFKNLAREQMQHN
jgi:hypothetical protein